MEMQISQMRDRSWFTREDDLENDWVLLEGKMSPKFLHLEDDNFVLPLEELDIGGSVTSDMGPILQHLFDFYSDLFAPSDTKTVNEIDAFLDGLSDLPKSCWGYLSPLL